MKSGASPTGAMDLVRSGLDAGGVDPPVVEVEQSTTGNRAVNLLAVIDGDAGFTWSRKRNSDFSVGVRVKFPKSASTAWTASSPPSRTAAVAAWDLLQNG